LGYGNTNNLGDGGSEMGTNLAAIDLGTNKTAVAVSAGGSHTCALLNDGTVKCWGEGGSGQLGKGNTNDLGDGGSEMGANLAVISLVPSSAPWSVIATASGASAIVSWAAPVDRGQSPITSYTVTSAPGNKVCASSTTTCTVASLDDGRAYSFTVVASNSAGNSPVSAVSNVVAFGSVPAYPTNVSAAAGTGQATISWTAPSNGGSAITSYTVTSSPGSKTCTTTTATSCTITGLTNATSYTFTVKATNSIGTSLPSAASTAITIGWSACHTSQPDGYWLLEQDGQVYAFGSASSFAAPTIPAGRTVIDIEATGSGCGYWVMDSSGQFHRAGDAGQIPSVDLRFLAGSYDFALAPDGPEKVVSTIPTQTGLGAYVFTSAGRVLRTGDATAIKDSAGREDLTWITRLNRPIVDARLTTSKGGYWLLAEDGGVFSFGDAVFAGSVPEKPLNEWVNEEIISMAPDKDGNGYVVVAKSGKAWWFNHAVRQQLADVLHAAFGTRTLNAPIAAVMARNCGGYIMVANDGGVFATPFSDCSFQGSLGANPPNTDIIALTPIG